MSHSTHNRSFQRWAFPGNWLHWYWQPKTIKHNTTYILNTKDEPKKTAIANKTNYTPVWYASHDLKPGNCRSQWLSWLIRFLAHSTCWVLLADDLRWPGFKSRSGHEFSVGWTNGRYAMRLISRTGTEGPPASSFKLWQVPPLEVTTLRWDRNVHIIIIIIF